ncbi:MAG: hypothetical protein PVG66_07005 [Chromatiales bacterium]|jgi:hypothetical protein
MILFISSYLTVFLLVFQQQNVTHRRYLWATTTSIAITVSQFVLIKSVTASNSWEILFMACGGVLGVLSSMYLHPRLMKMYQNRDQTQGVMPTVTSPTSNVNGIPKFR